MVKWFKKIGIKLMNSPVVFDAPIVLGAFSAGSRCTSLRTMPSLLRGATSYYVKEQCKRKATTRGAS